MKNIRILLTDTKMQKYIFFFQIYNQKYHEKGIYKQKKCCKSMIHSIFAVASNKFLVYKFLIACVFCQLFNEAADVVDTVFVNAVVNKFTVAFRGDDACTTKNSEVLRCD